MSGNLFVQTDGLRHFSRTHSDVATGLSQINAEAAGTTGVEASHGAIAASVSTALNGLLGARHSAMSTTATSGHTLSELLRRAAQAYEEGDLESAGKLKAAADSISGDPGAGADGGAAESCPGAGATGGAGAMGQMLGQVGQQVGQLASSVVQPLQGLAQGLSQLPQQMMQGVQQVGGALGGTGAGDAATKATAVDSDQDAAVDSPGEPDDHHPDHHAEDRRERPEPERSEPVRHAQAAPGDSDIRGRTPVAESAEPAQTRPQQSPL